MTSKVYGRAKEEFYYLLSLPNTKEFLWQDFFSRNPFVLSESLPLRLRPSDIYPMGRPGISEPDFIFYPKENVMPFVHGVIEIKRPSTLILSRPRENILRLSSDADTAFSQAKLYSKNLNLTVKSQNYNMLAMGNELHAFIILGLSDEIFSKVTNDILLDQYKGLLPPNFRLIPYDTLFKIFSSKIPPQILLLVPDIGLASITMPAVDYSKNGTVINVPHAHINQYAGVRAIQTRSGFTLKVKEIGHCIFCGEKNGYISLSAIKKTLIGSFQEFFHKEENGLLLRTLQCNKLISKDGNPFTFLEIYDPAQVARWFTELEQGKCGRCGSININLDEFDNWPEQIQKRWECRNCGFDEELHAWGPSSAGA